MTLQLNAQMGHGHPCQCVRVSLRLPHAVKDPTSVGKMNEPSCAPAYRLLPLLTGDEYSCGEPPQVPHAIIIDQEYRELFAVDSQVTYQCEDGYTLLGGSNKMSIVCHYGNWTTPSSCSEWGT